MSGSIAPLSEPDAVAQDLVLERFAADILLRHRSRVRELQFVSTPDGVIIRGRTATFYGKQVVLHEVLQRGLAVAANHIRVGSQSGVVPI
jgi:hypothetical protein